MFKHTMAWICLVIISLSPTLLHAESAISVNKSTASKNLFIENNDEDDFLSPDKAFRLDLTAKDAENLEASFEVEPGYYLYKQRIKFVIKDNASGQIERIDMPAGEIKDDPNFGQQEVYHHDFNASIKLIGAKNPVVQATYQGCSEKGLCYAPQTKTFALDINADNKNSSGLEANQYAASGASSFADGGIADALKSGNLWLVISLFFVAGLLLSFTPCVFPMIPILSGIIIGKNAHTSRMHAFTLSLAYTLGMCLTYTLMGIAAGLSGQLLSNALQTPWALGFGALVFVILALSMFGFYELKLPSNLENSIFSLSHRIKGGHLLSDFLMGALSALIISPCVAAPLAGALLYISKTHDVVLGGVALFALSLGMGAPLLLIGASAGTLLPKVGAWMNAVRNFFGVVMLGVAIWLIAPIIPVSVQMALWAALLIVPAIYMHAIDALPTDAKPALKLWKGVAIMMLIAGIALLVGALSGAKSPLQPLSGLVAKNGAAQHSGLNFTRVNSLAELETQLSTARGKQVMLDFYADWCVACKEYEQFVFSDPRIQAALKDTVLLQVDATAQDDHHIALQKRFGLFGLPGIIFFDAETHEIKQAKITGYKDANAFLAHLNNLDSCLPDTIKC